MKTAVLDTSALVRLYVPDGPLPEGTEDTIEAAIRAEIVLLVPELALAEAAQVLHKKALAGLLEASEADEVLAAILALPIEVVGHRDLIAAALRLARSTRLSVYDAVFLALARERRADLLSADEQLVAEHRELRGPTG
jgi:predicted nucleic acid-binding protein